MNMFAQFYHKKAVKRDKNKLHKWRKSFILTFFVCFWYSYAITYIFLKKMTDKEEICTQSPIYGSTARTEQRKSTFEDGKTTTPMSQARLNQLLSQQRRRMKFSLKRR